MSPTLGLSARAAVDPSKPPTVGLIVPPSPGAVPDDGPALYPRDVRFVAAGLGLERMTLTDYDRVNDKVSHLACDLVARGADAVSLMGTSLSFYRGSDFNRRLAAIIRAATGLPASTMSCAVVNALAAVGVRRVAVATAYVDAVNSRLAAFLTASGFEVTALRGLAITDVSQVSDVSEGQLADIVRRVHIESRQSDGVLLSCGGLRTLEVTAALEEELDCPVVSSSPAGFWDAVRLVGHSGRSAHSSRLFRWQAPSLE